MITLTNYNSSNGNAEKIYVLNRSNITIKNTSGTDITSSLSGIIQGAEIATLPALVGLDYVDILLLACDVPLYSQTDKERF